MCGIAGTRGRGAPETVHGMVGRLAHRGPDARGFAESAEGSTRLGHCRLAIMDPARGYQPIRHSGEGPAIVANGEIYNFGALRSRLAGRHRFATSSDTESALALFTEVGPDCVRDLDGMFALAISDGEDLFLARDPVGVKPLYWGEGRGGLVFASEIKALVGLADTVREFPPGAWFHSRLGMVCYYQVPDRDPVPRTPKEHVGLVRDALDRSVRKRLMSDVPVGAFLSGGLDSSLIVALVRPHVDELHTFAVGVEGSPDLEAARVVARHLDTVHHEHVLDPDEVSEKLPEILYHLESFDQDLVRSAVPAYFTSRLAAEEVKVVLTGEGADELFAGYEYYRDIQDPARLRRELRRSVTSLHDVNLQRVDRMTMAHSIEGRVPFLDVEMIELAQTVPSELKLKSDGAGRLTEKWVLRQAGEPMLPREIVRRRKAQFDQGSGAVDLLSQVVDQVMSPDEARRYAARNPSSRLRSAEECVYHRILCDAYPEPGPVLANVARWADRPVAS